METIKYNEMVWNTIILIDLRKTCADSINDAEMEEI